MLPNVKLHCGYSNRLLRCWQSTSVHFSSSNLIYPIFISDNPDASEEIISLPNQRRLGVNHLPSFLEPLVSKGLQCVLLFGCLPEEHKDATGKSALSSFNPIPSAVKCIKSNFGSSLLVACDVCLCAYTNHGHCGCLSADGDSSIDNAASIKRLAQISVYFARAGADIIAPSDMMDGRVGAIRQALDDIGLSERVALLSYSAKFASCFYGPFREAAKSAPSSGDRKAYQLPPGSRGLAVRAAIRDANEGADFIMVKPGLPYLDVIREIKTTLPHHPLAVYHVSGEYAMLYHAAKAGALDLEQALKEVMTSFLRAGATIIITYFTPLLLDMDLSKIVT